jgi:PII interaction protein X
MANETYLNHPTFGLLFSVCTVEENQEIYTTLYAQRLFFLVTAKAKVVEFEPISRNDARLLVEQRLRIVRRLGTAQEYEQLQVIHRRTFANA